MSYPHELLHNGAQLRLVGVHPTAKTAFYVNDGKGGVIGVRVYPDGRQVVVNPSYGKLAPRSKKDKTEGYKQFSHAWGQYLYILASHAVYCAWRHEIPAGMTIDHINGVTTDNSISNLRCVSNEINNRDGGFLTILRNRGFNPATIQRHYLLRYYDRMALLKSKLSKRCYYTKLTKDVLRAVLYLPEEQFQVDLFVKSLKTKQLCQTTSKNCAD